MAPSVAASVEETLAHQVEETSGNGRDQILKIGEVANLLRIPESSLYRLAEDGRIPCLKVGKHWRFRMSTLTRWMEDQEKERWPSLEGK